jgi:hypothetical protein
MGFESRATFYKSVILAIITQKNYALEGILPFKSLDVAKKMLVVGTLWWKLKKFITYNVS